MNRTCPSVLSLPHCRALLMVCFRCFVLFVCSLSAAVYSAPSHASGSIDNPLLLSGDLHHDASGRLQIDDVLARGDELDWENMPAKTLNLGFNTDAVWLRVPVPGGLQGDGFLLEVGYALLDQLDVYFVVDGGVVQKVSTGDQRSFWQRPIWHRNYLMPLPEMKADRWQLYVRVQSEGSVEVPLRIWERDAFWNLEQGTLLVKGAFAGILLVMVLYNIFVFLVVRDQSYLYYVGYGFSILLFQLSIDGLAYQYMWPDLKGWHQSSIVLFVCFAAVFRCMFTIAFLNLPSRWSAAAWVLSAVVTVALLLASLSVVIPYNLAIKLAALLVLPSTMLCLGVGAILLYQGLRRARYFVAGWLVYFVGAALFALSKMGWLPVNLWTEYLLQVGVTVEIVLFSMALADSINLERREKQQAQRQSIQNLERYRSLYENAVEGIYQSDIDGRLIAVNPAMAAMLGYSAPEEMIQEYLRRDVSEFLDESDYHALTRQIMEKGKIQNFEIKGFRRDGQVCWMSVSAKVISGIEWDRDAIVEGFVFDITQRKRNEEQLMFLSRHDPLTGLVNRREFESRLHQALEEVHHQGEHHTLLLLDLDQFKLVNDTCGHMAGDELLRQVTLLLRQLTRGGDVLARLGGDEFAILLTNCSEHSAVAVAEKIRTQIQNLRFEWDDRLFNPAGSVGLVHLMQHMDSVKEVINLADAACHTAKNSGRNRVHVYDPEDKRLASHQTQLEWAARISESIENDYFTLYVQPIQALSGDLFSGKSYEVLLRLRYQGELVFPGTFLPAAERYNLMPQVDRWVVRNLFHWLSQNAEKQLGIADVSVNLSGLTLGDNEFPGFLREQFKRYGIAPEKICFEITETIAVTNLSSTLKFIEEFRDLGCSFSLDDFGSGFSSYGYLKTLPVDYLKIDGAFVKDMVESEIDRAMVESINRIGHVMGKKTIAEFVENDSIAELLRRIGVDYAQGYGISKPFPIDEIEAIQSAG
ncbi:MAG: EAL domain-containing protein [Ketobacter sp.]|nr:EAL domain-containing protein [Ketobacter sp.]